MAIEMVEGCFSAQALEEVESTPKQTF